MKKPVLSIALIIISICVLSIAASAQRPIRLQFAKGANSTSVKGNTAQSGVTYVLRARSGQKIVIDLEPASRVGVKVEHDGRFGQMILLREERGGHYEIGLEESGDYTIFIGSTVNKPVTFNMTVKITKLSEI